MAALVCTSWDCVSEMEEERKAPVSPVEDVGVTWKPWEKTQERSGDGLDLVQGQHRGVLAAP